MSAAWQVYSGGRCSFDHDPCGSAGTIASPFSPYNPAHYSSDQLPSSSSTRIPLPQPNDSHEMRTFRIQGPFGLNISLATSVPGTLRVTFPNRAQSEPPVNVAASPVAPLSRSHSDYSFSIPYEYPMIQDNPTEFQRPGDNFPRPPSPALTEIILEDPTHEEVLVDLQQRGIKVRDFAHEPRVDSIVALETFDPWLGIAELEHRLTQVPRSFAISGKTLRRLLDMGWIDGSDLAECHQMDLDALQEYDSRGPHHPMACFKWTKVPDKAERTELRLALAQKFIFQDRVIAAARRRELAEQLELERTEQVKEAFRLRELEREELEGLGVAGTSFSSPRKRNLTNGQDAGDDNSESDKKRQRLSSGARKASPPILPRQYPAPLHSYNPELYPEAAIAIQSQSQPQPPPPVLAPPRNRRASASLSRENTPPVRSDTPPPDDDSLSPKKSLTRGLGRTQTFSQL